MALQLLRFKTLQNPRFIQSFSSSSSSSSTSTSTSTSISNGGESPPSSSPPPPPSSSSSSSSSFSSYFSDVKASLKQPTPPRRIFPSSEAPSFSPLKPSNEASSLEDIRRKLSGYRPRTSPLEKTPSSSPSQAFSLQDLYKKNVTDKGDESGTGGGSLGSGKMGKLNIPEIRESLRQFKQNNANQNQTPNNHRFGGFGGGPGDRGGNSKVLDSYSLRSFKDSLNMRPESGPSSAFGGSGPLPASVFGRELGLKSQTEPQGLKTMLYKGYGYEELGAKLRQLRPENTEGNRNWFSLEELNERLSKLRQLEEKLMDENNGFKDLRECMLKLSNEEKTKKASVPRLDILGHLRGTPMMHAPPKEELVEKYFHPDNMSSEEKLKLELQKVRDEFKMSESDCGSSRVQVAQLTTKIKHLSSVLHKKDKHSRKGLQAMVQRRKKLLKYLRRTDWDSYCLVLSKLGLRDNPDYKH